MDDVSPCGHEEADTRIALQAQNAVSEGHISIMINANHTDILVIAISVMPSLMQLGLDKLWVSFGKGEKIRWIPVHKVTIAIGPEKHVVSSFSMLSVAAMLSRPFMVKQRNLHGKPGMYVMQYPAHLQNSANAPLQ